MSTSKNEFIFLIKRLNYSNLVGLLKVEYKSDYGEKVGKPNPF